MSTTLTVQGQLPNITSLESEEQFRVRQRLEYHKAILESFGIVDLSSLGKLTMSGNVVPQVGLTRPTPNLFQGEIAFQSAFEVVPQARTSGTDVISLASLGGTARRLAIMPESMESLVPNLHSFAPVIRPQPPLARDTSVLTSTAQPLTTTLGIIPIDTAYWAATWIHLEDNTTVVFKYPNRYLTIIAEKLTVGQNVTFTWERPTPTSFPYTPAKPPKIMPAAPISDTLTGIDGQPGTNGVSGGKGPDGEDAPEAEVWVLELNGSSIFDFKGQDAFAGGLGQDGGDGQDGGKGRPELYDYVLGIRICKSGRGSRGHGGGGGAAGNGARRERWTRKTSLPVRAATRSLCVLPEPVLVLVTGGLNDLNFRTVVDPTTSTTSLLSGVRRRFYDDAKVMLKKITGKFTNAKVVITGYYPIISEDSNTGLLEPFLIAAGVGLGGIAGGFVAANVKPRIVANCRLVAEQSALKLQAAVDEVNDDLGGEPRVLLALPPFGRRNAALAPESWIFGINGDLTPEDNPVVAGNRAGACVQNRTRTGDVEQCKRASVGHPNARGAEQYAAAIDAMLTGTADPLRNPPPFPRGFMWGAATASHQVEGE